MQERLATTMAPSTRRIIIKLAGCFLLVTGFIVIFRHFSIDLVTIKFWQKGTFSYFIGVIWITIGIFLLTTKFNTPKDIFLSNIFVPLIIVELIMSSLKDQIIYGYSQEFYWSMAINLLLGIVIIFCRLKVQRREKREQI